MVNKFKRYLVQNYINYRGIRTKKKILVIESDDWGSIRMPSKDIYEKSIEAGIPVDKCPYNRYDTLANTTDFVELFEVLRKIKDSNGKSLCITANTVIANPDFGRIKLDNFKKYYYEKFTDTIERYYPHEKVFDCWKSGISEKLFHPQFHGREHLNICRWLNGLQIGLPETKFSFDNEYYGLSTTITTENRKSYQAAFDQDSEADLNYHKKVISDGLEIFNDIFGYYSKSFIAPNYIWATELEQYLAKLGVETIQGARAQWDPSSLSLRLKRHFMGEKNINDQVYLIRNVIFEPTLNQKIDWVGNALKQVNIAFKWNKPAVICSHRVNYVGTLNEQNRKKNLLLLEEFMKKVKEKNPDIIFMTSDELGEFLRRSRSNIGTN